MDLLFQLPFICMKNRAENETFRPIWANRKEFALTDQTWPWIPYDEKSKFIFQNFSIYDDCQEGSLFMVETTEDVDKLKRMLRISSLFSGRDLK